MGTVKYIEGSKFAHDQRAILAKVEDITPTLGALTESRVSISRELFAVCACNQDSGKSAILSIFEDYDDALEDAQLCFSAMHELEVGFAWKIRVDQINLKAK